MAQNRLSMFLTTSLLAITMIVVALWTPLRSQANAGSTVLRPYRFVPIPITQAAEEALVQKFASIWSSLESVEANDLFTPGLTQPPNSRTLATREEAESLLGHRVLIPTYVPPGISATPSFQGLTSGTATVALDAKGVRQLLARTPLSNVHVPDDYDGAKITVETWPVVFQIYRSDDESRRFVVVQTVPPALVLDSKIDAEELRRQLVTSLMPGEVAGQLLAIDDWTSTLPVPIPEGSTFRYIDLPGSPALVVADNRHDRAMAIWIHGGTLILVVGNLPDDEVIRVIKGLQ